uniref:RWP-RK domain-containing protein n=1 Tax=Hyaloperonospora arabidopsidis (strain Emoy2) TaxID=559515 RepID=M4BJE9_HYAAE
MAPPNVLEEEIEASVSLLHMRHPSGTVVNPTLTKDLPAGVENRDALHASLLKVVAKQACNQLSLRQRIYVHKKSATRLTALSRELTLEELRPHFGQPIVEVAREFGICTTFLKKLCRQCGIKRWPHRQIRSLNRTIQMLEQVESATTSPEEKATYAAQIKELKDKQRAVMEDPDVTGGLKRMKKPGTPKSATEIISTRADRDKESLQSRNMMPDGDAKNLLALAVAVDAVSSCIGRNETGLQKAMNQEGATPWSSSLDVHIPSPDMSMAPVVSSLTTPMQAAAVAASRSLKSLKMSPTNRFAMVKHNPDAENRLCSFSIALLQPQHFCMEKR